MELREGQELKAVDDQHAEVYFEDGQSMMSIAAEPARDANGTAVPTAIAVSEGDIVTLTVHHRAGNPVADGAPFDYPITPGPAFEVGFSTVIVIGPKDEAELREERERAEREHREAEHTERQVARRCVVPRLKGRSLRVDRKRLRAAGCRLGEVRGTRSRTARVVKQDMPPGKALAVGAEVGIELG